MLSVELVIEEDCPTLPMPVLTTPTSPTSWIHELIQTWTPRVIAMVHPREVSLVHRVLTQLLVPARLKTPTVLTTLIR
jgi:hypothetical protein